MRKKAIPLHLLKIVQDTVDKANNNNLILSETSIDALITLRDNDIDSSFYFKINSSYQERNGKNLYSLEYLPSDGASLIVFKDSISLDNVKSHLENWLHLLSRYNLSYPLFDDPIIQSYLKDLEPDFEIIDEDASQVPYKFDEQLHIINIYNNLIELVLKEKTTENQEEAEFIVNMIEANKKQIPKQTKKQVVENLKRVVAYCFKYSIEVGKSIVADVIVEVGKRLLTGG